ncbi:MAG: Asp23/Gls24 family envelope stress response protein [Firmicutes bacterium]|uniref:Asp23/Gls24 family envelope stress response protein n=1 Tax=Candidatus Onthovivens merdipullorum TaxID=2840889 RepID=A0A9D9DHX2_9BACL|nr:Asp23/Gls24 family envelope stress response protein [Candidatus Onthovivens merdipullorum]
MSDEIKNLKNIQIQVSTKDIAELVGEVCSSSYGVLGLTKVKNLRSQLVTLLNKDNYIEGILISKIKSKYVIDVHVIVAYGVKISEVVNELRKGIAYNLNKKYGPVFSKVNIYVEELRDL